MEQKYILLFSTHSFQTYYLVSLLYPTETDGGAFGSCTALQVGRSWVRSNFSLT